MKLIVGLGNPGERYKNNRHNVGFRVMDAVASQMANDRWQMANRLETEVFRANELLLAKPQTFMNESGRVVKKLVDYYKIPTNDLYVVYDDLDIPLGAYKIQKGKGPRRHNGVESVNAALGTKDYWHVRIGIENRARGRDRVRGEQYVLEDFTKDERQFLDKVTKEICLILIP